MGSSADTGYWTRTHDVEVDLVGADHGPVAGHLRFLGSIKWQERAQFDHADIAHLVTARRRVSGATERTPLIAVTRTTAAGSDLLAAVYRPEQLLAAWRHG